MALLRRVTDAQSSDWVPVPIGVRRFRINPAPEVQYSERFNNHMVRFPLLLTVEEQNRVLEENGKPPEGMQQSFRVTYNTGLSLGYVKRDGQYKSTKLVDFLAPCLGQQNMKRFMEWVINGGGPPKAADPDDPDQELEQIKRWLGWWEDLEVFGSIRHEEDADGTIWARFGGPLAVGSMPSQREDEYQAIGRGKLRSMIAEYEQSLEASKSDSARVADDRRPNAGATRSSAPVARGVASTGTRAPARDDRPAVRYTATGEQVDDDIPF